MEEEDEAYKQRSMENSQNSHRSNGEEPREGEIWLCKKTNAHGFSVEDAPCDVFQ